MNLKPADIITFDANLEMIEREALLFRAGDYPDKGITVSESDLDKIISGTTEAPIKVAHVNTPFDGKLGFANSLVRRGTELFGKIRMPKAAWEYLQSVGITKLSVGIPHTKEKLSEVSLVDNPRIQGAAIFADNDHITYYPDIDLVALFAAGKEEHELLTPEEIKALQDKAAKVDELTAKMANFETTIAEQAKTIATLKEDNTNFSKLTEAMDADIKGKTAQISTLINQGKSDKADAKIAAFVAQGKLSPAQVDFAKQLLMLDDSTIKFGDKDYTASALFEELISKSPAIVPFGEQGRAIVDDQGQVKFEGEVFDRLGVSDLTPERRTELQKKYGIAD